MLFNGPSHRIVSNVKVRDSNWRNPRQHKRAFKSAEILPEPMWGKRQNGEIRQRAYLKQGGRDADNGSSHNVPLGQIPCWNTGLAQCAHNKICTFMLRKNGCSYRLYFIHPTQNETLLNIKIHRQNNVKEYEIIWHSQTLGVKSLESSFLWER